MISVFIPAYNAHDSIDYAIMSLVNQTIKQLIKVFIINDGSKKDYKETIDKFSPYIDIKEITHRKNMGVGFARQTALDTLSTKYFAFLDADDAYSDATAFQSMYEKIEESENYAAIFSYFYEELRDGSYRIRERTEPWIFAKIYRSSFVQKNQLSFPKQKANEDNVFNISLIGCLKDEEVVVSLQKPIYLWKFVKTSITRNNNSEHWFYQDLKGLVDGLYYIKHNPNIPKQYWHKEIEYAFFMIYFRYYDNIIYKNNQNFSKEMLDLAKNLYNKILSNYTELENNEYIKTMVNETVLDYQKPYANIDMFKNFLNLVKQDIKEGH